MAIRKRGNSFESKVMYQGKIYYKSHGPVSRTVAKEKDAQFKAGLYDGSYFQKKAEEAARKNRIKLKDFKDEYLAYYERQWSPGSYRRTKYLVANLVEHFGEEYLDEIIPLEAERYKKKRREAEKSQATVNREINCLSNIFEVAMTFGKASLNPMKKVKRFTEDNEKMWPLTDAEENRLLAVCEATNEKKGRDYLRDLVEVALYSGMRQGEIFCMKKEHVNFRHEFVHIPKTKTHKSRKIPMNDTLRAALKRAMKRSGESEYVFTGEDGGRLRNLKKGFWQAVSDAGLIRKGPGGKSERFRFHDLRHTFGTRLGMNGYDLKTIMEIMGHKTTKVAMRCQHPAPDHKLSVVKTLDQVPSKSTTGTVVRIKKV